MAKKDNVTRLPTRPTLTARRAVEPAQAALRDYVTTRRQLAEELAQVDTLLEHGAANGLEHQVTALGELLTHTHTRLVRLATTIEIAQHTADATALNEALTATTAATRVKHASQKPASPAHTSEETTLSTADELNTLGADSIVIQSPTTASGRPRPYQRGDDGRWHSHTIGRSGISSDTLWNDGSDLIVVLRTERPVTVGATPVQRVTAEAGFRGWQVRDDGPGRLSLARSDVVVDLRYSTASGSITKATRTQADRRADHAAAVGKLGTVLRWLNETP